MEEYAVILMRSALLQQGPGGSANISSGRNGAPIKLKGFSLLMVSLAFANGKGKTLISIHLLFLQVFFVYTKI